MFWIWYEVIWLILGLYFYKYGINLNDDLEGYWFFNSLGFGIIIFILIFEFYFVFIGVLRYCIRVWVSSYGILLIWKLKCKFY